MTRPAAPQPVAAPLLAEHWLLASDDSQRLFSQGARLAQAAGSSALTAWRLEHKLVRRVPLAGLSAALAQALASGTAGVHLHADLPEAALDDLLLRSVPGAQEHRVMPVAWPADDAAADAALLTELARPDGWVEVGWRLGGHQAVPPLLAALDQPASAASHQAAFAQWAQQALAGLDAEDLATLAEWEGLPDDALPPLVDQADTAPPAAASLQLLAVAEGCVVAPVAGGPRVAQAAGRGGPGWRTRITWASPLPAGGSAATLPSFQVLLQTDDDARQQPRLRVRVLLMADHWQHRAGIQLWLYPQDDAPLQLALGDGADAGQVNGLLVFEVDVPLGHHTASGLLEALAASRLLLSAEPVAIA